MWKMTIAFTALSGSRFWSRHVLHSEPKLENTNCTETISTAVTRHKQQTLGRLRTWIIERLDRKLADAIGSNIVEKCDVTLSTAIQPLKFDVLRVLRFLAYFTIIVLDYTYWPCFEVKNE